MQGRRPTGTLTILVILRRQVKPPMREVDDRLVCRHHDRRVRYLSNKLRRQATVDAADALLLADQRQRLPEPVISVAALAKPRSCHLCHHTRGQCQNLIFLKKT